MTQSPKIFSQVYPSPDVDTQLCLILPLHSAQLSIFVANHSTSEDQISIMLVPANQSSTLQKNYLAYATRLVGTGILAFSGLFLGSLDQIRVISHTGNSSFTATGLDVS